MKGDANARSANGLDDEIALRAGSQIAEDEHVVDPGRCGRTRPVGPAHVSASVGEMRWPHVRAGRTSDREDDLLLRFGADDFQPWTSLGRKSLLSVVPTMASPLSHACVPPIVTLRGAENRGDQSLIGVT